MFRLSIEQYQLLILALLGGGALVVGLALAYLAFWRPREGATDDDLAGMAAMTPRSSRRPFMPWILIVTYVLAVIFAIVYTAMVICNPPNW